MKNDKVELLSPAGNFESMISAIQNGANAVYFGANRLNARANSKNFDNEELKNAIEYAKLRNVKTHMTLNILIKNDEFEEAIELVKYVYELGLDAVIIQDLGLARVIIDNFPELEVHASTQCSIYNLEGVNELTQYGFNRVVLARELSVPEISNICKNTDAEIEVFIHGALCISYSGQCLMSSIIGQRSGNRGKCAGPCRMGYDLINKGKEKLVDSGYLLSSKDVCTLDILPNLIEAGVKSFKIEGRMKSPEYVGIVTNIYRKYIDLYYSESQYIVDEEDRKMLLQVFNRGGFSTGYINGKLGKDMMYTHKASHMGIEIGKVLEYHKSKGYVKVKLLDNISLGDSIVIKDDSCKISELMYGNNNTKTASKNEVVTIGRIHGNIEIGNSVFKTVDLGLQKSIERKNTFENIKRDMQVFMQLKENEFAVLKLIDTQTNISVEVLSENKIEKAMKTATTKERIIEQLEKTGNSVFQIENIDIDMNEELYIPISMINELRRNAIEELEKKIKEIFIRKPSNLNNKYLNLISKSEETRTVKNVTVFFRNINLDIEYDKLKYIDNVYIHVKEFLKDENTKIIDLIVKKFNVYVYLPNITKGNYIKLFEKNLKNILEKNIDGVVISNISQLNILKENGVDISKLKIIANYTMNCINNVTIRELEKLNIYKVIMSPEFSKDVINNMSGNVERELIVYGRTLLMTSEYCPIGTYIKCEGTCQKGKYILKDRLGYEFPIYTDRINCNSLLYNSKITSLSYKGINVDSICIDILDESFDQIQDIINVYKAGDKYEGKDYTNCNINKEI